MHRSSAHSVFAIGLTSVAVFIGSACAMAQKRVADGSRTLVNLICRTARAPRSHANPTWLTIELRSGTDDFIRRNECAAGDATKFSDLKPGVYRVCLAASGRKNCESVDLTPDPAENSVDFTKDLHMPGAAGSEAKETQVSVRALAIPRAALDDFELAQSDRLKGDEQGVLSHLQQAIDHYPDYAEAWNNLGAYWHRNGDDERAVESFTRVTEIDPDFSLGWRNLGSCLIAGMKYEKAIEANRKASALAPTDPVAKSQLALSFYYLHKYEEAKPHFERVLELDPGYINSPQIFLAHISMGEGNFEKAAGYLRSYLEYHPHGPDASHAKSTLKAIADGSVLYRRTVKR